jgi:hypothetical protein
VKHFGLADRGDLASVLNEAFSQQQAGSQFLILAGGTHGDGNRLAGDMDLQWLLGSEAVVGGTNFAAIPFRDLRKLDALAHGAVPASGYIKKALTELNRN